MTTRSNNPFLCAPSSENLSRNNPFLNKQSSSENKAPLPSWLSAGTAKKTNTHTASATESKSFGSISTSSGNPFLTNTCLKNTFTTPFNKGPESNEKQAFALPSRKPEKLSNFKALSDKASFPLKPLGSETITEKSTPQSSQDSKGHYSLTQLENFAKNKSGWQKLPKKTFTEMQQVNLNNP